MKKTLLTTFSLLALSLTAIAQADRNKPFGWTNCTSLTSGDDYTTKGAFAVESPKTITLTTTGGDDKNAITNAIKNNQTSSSTALMATSPSQVLSASPAQATRPSWASTAQGYARSSI